MSIINPAIYEVNARLLVKRFQTENLLEIPSNYWKELKKKGIDYVWLMGVWEISKSSIKKYCFADGLVDEYKNALPDWRTKDVAGSPYAIEDYVLNASLGTSNETLLELRRILNKIGLKLVLDFIPNHFNSESKLLKTNPDIFLKGHEGLLARGNDTFFVSPYEGKGIFAHGKDPYFPAWTDTAQVDYSTKTARDFMFDRLKDVSKLCDGVRCDMAMLILNDVFCDTWRQVVDKDQMPKAEFWKESIKKIKQAGDDFIFIAEAYWDLEWELQQAGFDYTYDKRLYDRLHKANVWEIHEHLQADLEYQNKSIRFIENHDEQRAIKEFGEDKSMAASVVISSVPGMRFYNDGQFEGKSKKHPVQLAREAEEKCNDKLKNHYNKLLKLSMNYRIEDTSEWKLQRIVPAWEGNDSYKEMLCWQYTSNHKIVIVVVNYSDRPAQGKLGINFPVYSDSITLHDLFNGNSYLRHKESLLKDGLFIDLHPFGTHFFVCET